MDYYQILGVPKTANTDEIRQKYKKLALKYHPDRHCGQSSKDVQQRNMERFKQVSEAFEVLSDPQKRREYDFKDTTYSYNGYEMHDPFEIFKQFFGSDPFQSQMLSTRMNMNSFENIMHPFFQQQEQQFFGMPTQRNTSFNTSFCNMNQTMSSSGFGGTSTSKSESVRNGVKRVRVVNKDRQGNMEEVIEVYYGQDSARIVKWNGKTIEQSGNIQLLSL